MIVQTIPPPTENAITYPVIMRHKRTDHVYVVSSPNPRFIWDPRTGREAVAVDVEDLKPEPKDSKLVLINE